MEEQPERSLIKTIDVQAVLRSKNPRLEKIIPSFAINYLKRIIHQDELNDFLNNWGHLKDARFIGAALEYFKISYNVLGKENIPAGGRYIFASNHPLGGLDGLVFMYELSKYFSDIKFPVNDILLNIENLSGIFLPVNKHGAQAKEAVKALDEAYASECQILYFQWHKSFITKAIQHKRDIVPAFFSGRNSSFFYNLSNLRNSLGIGANIEMLYLPDEMFRQRGKDITLVFGKSIPWQTFDHSKSPAEWADWVKSKSYDLESFIDRGRRNKKNINLH
jgi:hypothetical protein